MRPDDGGDPVRYFGTKRIRQGDTGIIEHTTPSYANKAAPAAVPAASPSAPAALFVAVLTGFSSSYRCLATYKLLANLCGCACFTGTSSPALLACDRPMAMAWLRLVNS